MNPPEPNRPEPIWRRYFLNPILAQLRQGVTPDQIALTLALGTVLGIFPVLGATTLLCAVAGIVLRLNQPILHLINYMVYPAQVTLIFFFIRVGESIYRAEPIAFSFTELLARFKTAPVLFFKEFAMTFLHCITAWLILAPLIAGAIYFLSRPLLRSAGKRLILGQQPS